METRYLLAYNAYLPDVGNRYKRWISRIRKAGYNVDGFCTTVNTRRGWYQWPELDKRWHRRDKKLMRLYEEFEKRASDCDCMINLHGTNLHPDFVAQLPTFNVFISNDDPEAWEMLGMPCASAYDHCFVGNISCLELYHGIGIKDVDFMPLGFFADDYNPDLTEKDILNGVRRHDCGFVGEGFSQPRRSQLERILSAVPQCLYYGRSWPNGYLHMDRLVAFYQKLKVGLNIHHTTGPVNRRTYALPANGVMQICDNRCRLGHLFKLSEEVVGVDSIGEMIDVLEYYLTHDEERRKIAVAGWNRAVRDYSEITLWKRMVKIITQRMAESERTTHDGQLAKWHGPPIKVSLDNELNLVKQRVKAFIKKGLMTFGYQISAQGPENQERFRPQKPYLENPVKGPVNIEIKQKQVEEGRFFEWPNIVALNNAVSSLVGPDPKRIIEIGGGTGVFAYEAAIDPARHIVSVELNEGAHDWAKKHRHRPNIKYLNHLPRDDEGSFDLVVSIEVVEHVEDYMELLSMVSNLAPRALLTTPNKLSRYSEGPLTGPPLYEYHVREWNAGEFYWLLRGFFREVTLYAMPNIYVPVYERIDVMSEMTPLIADCRKSYGRKIISRNQ